MPNVKEDKTFFDKQGKYGMLCNKQGHMLFPALYDSIRSFEPNLFMVKKDDFGLQQIQKVSFYLIMVPLMLIH